MELSEFHGYMQTSMLRQGELLLCRMREQVFRTRR